MSAALLILITVKATIVLSAAWLVTRAMAHCSAATRHLVWTLAVVAALVLPAVQVIGPRWALPVLPGDVPSAIVAEAAVGSPAIQERTGRPDTRRESGVSPAAPEISTARDRPLAAATEISWPALLGAVWLAGMAFAMVRLCAGLLSVRRIMRRAGDPADPQWTVIRDEIAAALGINASVALKMSAETTIPVACGIGTATVFLPPDAAEWPEERRRVVLLHEMAHVVRRDCLVQAIAQLARAVHWFNPFAHLAVARLRAEQERACDDLVLATGAEASAYAGHLLEIACAFRAERCPPWAALVMARPSQLEGRVLAILDDQRQRRPPARGVRAAVAVAAGALILPIGVLQLTAAAGPARLPAAPAMIVGERVGAGLALEAGPAPPMSVTAWLEDPSAPPQAPLSPDAVVTVATQFGHLMSDFDWDFDFDWFGPVPQPLVEMFGFPDPDPDPDPNPNPNPNPRFSLAGADKQAQSQSQSQAQDNAVSDETRRRVADALMTALNDENEDVRERALQALAGMRDARAIPGLAKALSDMSADVRMAALNALAQFSTTEAVDAVLTAIKDPNADVRAHAVRHVSALVGRRVLTDGKYVAVFLALLKDADPDVRVQAIAALGRLEQAEAVPALLPLLKDINSDVREQAAGALGDIGDPRAIDALTMALKDAEPDVRGEAARALGQIARGQRRRAPPGIPGPPPSPPRPPRVQIDADAINEMVARAQESAERQLEDFERQQEQLQRQQEQIQRQFERQP
jgi:HEAT repeat protein/beta-lactamase regulating signal transducer with metallopeptidase domain